MLTFKLIGYFSISFLSFSEMSFPWIIYTYIYIWYIIYAHRSLKILWFWFLKGKERDEEEFLITDDLEFGLNSPKFRRKLGIVCFCLNKRE